MTSQNHFELIPAAMGQDPVTGARWRAKRPVQGLAELNSHWRARDPEITVFHEDGRWHIVDGDEDVSCLQLDEALELANRAFVMLEEASQENTLREAGLSAQKWRFDTFRFVSLDDPLVMIAPHGEGWRAQIGPHEIKAETPAIAEHEISQTPHLHSRLLDLLQTIHVHQGRMARVYVERNEKAPLAFEQGLVEAVEEPGFETAVRLTEAGRAAIDADPRVVPLAIRERILELAGPALRRRVEPQKHRSPEVAAAYAEMPQDEKDAFVADNLAALTARARRTWALFFGDTRNQDSGYGIRQALIHDWDLNRSQTPDDPGEITIIASGSTEGGSFRDQNVALLEPWWEENETSTLLADTIVHHVDELRDLMKAHLSVEAAPAPRPGM